MADTTAEASPQASPVQPVQAETETDTTQTDSPVYPDPYLVSLKFTESYYTHDPPIPLPPLHVTNAYHFTIHGVDAIWHNMYLGPNSDFETFRVQYDCDIDKLVLMVARHVARGWYGIVSLTATKHSLVVVCVCERMWEGMRAGWVADEVEVGEGKGV